MEIDLLFFLPRSDMLVFVVFLWIWIRGLVFLSHFLWWSVAAPARESMEPESYKEWERRNISVGWWGKQDCPSCVSGVIHTGTLEAGEPWLKVVWKLMWFTSKSENLLFSAELCDLGLICFFLLASVFFSAKWAWQELILINVSNCISLTRNTPKSLPRP